VPINITGEWSGTWQSNRGPSGLLSAALSQTGSTITGTVVFSNSACFLAAGTLFATLNGTAWSGSVAVPGGGSINLNASIGSNSLTGNYSVVSGGACTGDTGTFSATLVVNPINVTGQWSGSWQSAVYVASGLLSASVAQSGVTMTGSVVFSGSPCFAGGTVSGTEIGNVWNGTMSAGGGTEVILSGSVTNTQIEGVYYVVSGGLCTGDYGAFALARQ
jgi:hypothetical protein